MAEPPEAIKMVMQQVYFVKWKFTEIMSVYYPRADPEALEAMWRQAKKITRSQILYGMIWVHCEESSGNAMLRADCESWWSTGLWSEPQPRSTGL